MTEEIEKEYEECLECEVLFPVDKYNTCPLCYAQVQGGMYAYMCQTQMNVVDIVLKALNEAGVPIPADIDKIQQQLEPDELMTMLLQETKGIA